MKRGKFIVIDGLGASGKDTQVEFLEKYLKDKGKEVVVTREHTRDTPPGELIEKIIKKTEEQIEAQALQLLYICDRRNHFVNVIEPELKKGKVVIGNRFYPVNVAYSLEKWRKKFLKINKMVVKKPDLVLIIDVPPEVALDRMNKRGGHDIFDQLETMKRCREGYWWYVNNSKDNCVLIDGNKSKEEVFEQVLREVKKLKGVE